MAGLAVLLADGNGRGGGDLRSENPIIGSWAGDRVVIAGDYADEGNWGVEGSLYAVSEDWEDISDKVIEALSDDSYLCEDLAKRAREGWPGEDIAPGLYACQRKQK